MPDSVNWRASPWKRWQASAIASVGYPLIAGLCRTLRWHDEGADVYARVLASGRQPIMAFWHGRILPATYYFRHRGIVVMTSENFDGEWIARIITRFGYGTARGSSSRGATRALVRLKRDMESGLPAAFTVDGPRGPALHAQPGAIWLAKATGNPIIPFHIETARYWTARSWDRTQVPRPFTDVAVVIGEPIEVSATSTEAEIEAHRLGLEQKLNQLMDRAQKVLGVRSGARC